jgi:hypothetical protein
MMDKNEECQEGKFEDILVEIKTMINKYYENIGRFGEVTDTTMEDLIADIDEILTGARLSKKKMILTKLEEGDVTN